MDVGWLLQGVGLVVFGVVIVVGGWSRLRGRRSRLDRIGDALGATRNVDGLPPTILGHPTEVPAPPRTNAVPSSGSGRPVRRRKR